MLRKNEFRIMKQLLSVKDIPPLVPTEAKAYDRELSSRELAANVPLSVDHSDGNAVESQRKVLVNRLRACVTDAETPRTVTTAADALQALLGLATWTDVSTGDPFRFDPPAEYDDAFIETVLTISVVLNQLGASLRKISPLLEEHASKELQRRLFDLFISHCNDYPKTVSIPSLCALLCTVLLAYPVESDRTTFIRNLFIVLSEKINALPMDGSHPDGLKEGLRSVVAINDLMHVLFVVTNNGFDQLNNDVTHWMLEHLRASIIGDGMLHIPGEHDMLSSIDAESIFRAAYFANPDVCQTAACFLRSGRNTATGNALSRVLNRMTAEQINKTKPEWRAYTAAYLEDAAVMRTKIGSLHGLLCGGTNTSHADAGNLLLFWRNQPVLIDLGKGYADSRMHSVAEIGGIGQRKNVCPQETPTDHNNERSRICSVSLANVYPTEANVRDYQRSMMPGSQQLPFLRIIDSITLDESEGVDFHFISLINPVEKENGLQLDDLLFSWNRLLTYSVTEIPWNGSTAYRITLHAEAALQHNVAFEFIPA